MPKGIYKRKPFTEKHIKNMRKVQLGKKLSGEHKKKIGLSNLGKKRSKETVEKLRKINLGRKQSKESKEKNRQTHLINKYLFTKKQIEKIRQAHLGKKTSDETRQKMSDAKKGDRHPNWKGGITHNPYPKEFDAKLKLEIRTRDNFICCLCGRTEREELEELNRALCVNHIDFDKNNCKENNLNTLCLRCNVKINRNREYFINYFNSYE